MKAIVLSRTLVDTYKNYMRTDISYALSELLGYVDYDYSTQISSIPVTQQDTIECPIEDAVYCELKEKFDTLDSCNEVAELLLWTNYFTGGRL